MMKVRHKLDASRLVYDKLLSLESPMNIYILLVNTVSFSSYRRSVQQDTLN